MPPPAHFRLRWKGAVTGPFPLARVSEMLRAGELSLLHNIEVDGQWLTIRDYFRIIGLTRAPAAVPADDPGNGLVPPSPGAEGVLEAVRPVDTRQQAGESLERAVREGYLSCGSTFLLLPLFALAVYGWHVVAPDASPLSLFILLIFTTGSGCFLPVAFVRRVGRQLELEGLGEIRQTQASLALALASLGFVLWLWCFWILVHQRP